MTGRNDTPRYQRSGKRQLPVRSLSRYDLLLAFIPTAFIVSILLGSLLSLGLQSALAGASLVGAIALVDALFLNPPKGAGRA